MLRRAKQSQQRKEKQDQQHREGNSRVAWTAKDAREQTISETPNQSMKTPTCCPCATMRSSPSVPWRKVEAFV
jgi:hypothetical protein